MNPVSISYATSQGLELDILVNTVELRFWVHVDLYLTALLDASNLCWICVRGMGAQRVVASW